MKKNSTFYNLFFTKRLLGLLLLLLVCDRSFDQLVCRLVSPANDQNELLCMSLNVSDDNAYNDVGFAVLLTG